MSLTRLESVIKPLPKTPPLGLPLYIQNAIFISLGNGPYRTDQIMTTQITDTTTRTVDFYFEGVDSSTPSKYWDAQNANFKYVEKKLVRLINNYKMNASVTFISTDAEHISALLTFEYGACHTNQQDDKKIDRDLNRIINSHKQPAHFSWPQTLTNSKAGN